VKWVGKGMWLLSAWLLTLGVHDITARAKPQTRVDSREQINWFIQWWWRPYQAAFLQKA